MNHRQLHRPQQTPQEIDTYALQAFQDDVVREFSNIDRRNTSLESTIYALSQQLNNLEGILTWINDHRPEALEAYSIAKAVEHRLTDSNNGEVMTEKMV